MPLFDAYLTVDWSASSTPKTGENSIWFALVERDKNRALRLARPENPPTRACALHRLGTLLDDLLKRNRRMLAGFDFPFGYPAGTAEALKLKGEPWRAMWSLLAEKIKDDEKNRNNRFDVANRLNRELDESGGPFWGVAGNRSHCHLGPKKSRYNYNEGLAEKRLVEDSYVLKAQPVWKLSGVGAVGGQTLTGIPVAHALRNDCRLKERCHVWPFETGLKKLAEKDLPAILLAEIYPSLVEPRSACCDVKDSKQVQAIALHLARLDSCGELAAIFAGPPCLRDGERERAVREEGWILGVTKRKPKAVPVDIDTARPGHD